MTIDGYRSIKKLLGSGIELTVYIDWLIDWYLTQTLKVFRYAVALHYTVSDAYERNKSLYVCLICLLVTSF